MELLFLVAFLACAAMAVRAVLLRPKADTDPAVAALVGHRVRVRIGTGGRVVWVRPHTAVLDELDGDWMRFSWAQPSPELELLAPNGWVHRSRVYDIRAIEG